jgi:MHS family proline/betaine transporter-like MFS transporter
MASFLALGLGFVVRPLGALVLGSYGDRAGRKAALTLTIMLMAVGTLLIAAAPPYAAIGVGAPLLIVCGRVLQGFSAGGEVGGATAFLVEHAPEGKRGQYASWLQASMGISNLLGALVATLVTTLLTEQQVGEWGWRVPFIIGLAIAPVGLWMRRALDETPHFREEQARQERQGDHVKAPLLAVLRNYPKELLTGLCMSVLWAVGPYALIIFMPIYVQKSLGFSSSQAFTAALVGNLFLIGGCVFSGTLSDRYGRRTVLRAAALILLIAVYPLMMWLKATHTLGALIVVQSLFCLMVAMYVGVAPAALSEVFPTAVRSSGMSLSYNTAVTVLGGFAPAILTWITYTTGVAFAPALYVMGACVVALVALTLLPQGRHV